MILSQGQLVGTGLWQKLKFDKLSNKMEGYMRLISRYAEHLHFSDISAGFGRASLRDLMMDISSNALNVQEGP